MQHNNWGKDRDLLAEAVSKVFSEQHDPELEDLARDAKGSDYANWLIQWSKSAGTALHLNLDQPFVELYDEYKYDHKGSDDKLSAAKQHKQLQSQFSDQVSEYMKKETDSIISELEVEDGETVGDFDQFIEKAEKFVDAIGDSELEFLMNLGKHQFEILMQVVKDEHGYRSAPR